MEELTVLLNHVDGSYKSFVLGISSYAKKKPERLKAVLKFMNNHPEATTSDIVGFVSDQPDFYEDAC